VIARVWRGWTSRENADAYQSVVLDTVVPGISARGIEGLRGPQLLRRDADEDEVEFMTVMMFDDWAGVNEFAGPDARTAVLPEPARRLLRRFDQESVHYEVVG
jgi:hypothetical protein